MVAASNAMQTGAIPRNVAQVHLTQHCNLACQHCYSLSGPSETRALDCADVCAFVEVAVEHGFDWLSLSGGEPLIYPALVDVLKFASKSGLRISMVTNGMLLRHNNVDAIAQHVSVAAVSLDGPPQLHNEMRGSKAAYAGAVRGMQILKNAEIPFGIVHTATEKTLPHLRWLAETAVSLGAVSLQFHPLEIVGRAREKLSGQATDGAIAARLFLLTQILSRDFSPHLDISVDLFNRETIRDAPSLTFGQRGSNTKDTKLSDVVNPIVLEADGRVLPVCSGFNDSYLIADLGLGDTKLQVDRWIQESYPRFTRLCDTVREFVLEDAEYPFVNWYEMLSEFSRADDL